MLGYGLLRAHLITLPRLPVPVSSRAYEEVGLDLTDTRRYACLGRVSDRPAIQRRRKDGQKRWLTIATFGPWRGMLAVVFVRYRRGVWDSV